MDKLTQVEYESTVSLWGSLEQELGLTGRFAIISRIGAGGMGEVFKARQFGIDRDVAIKVLAVDVQASADAKMRFQREARILSTLDHPNISKLYGFGFSGERPYQIMDYLEGCSLSARLEQGPLTIEEFKSIFSQIISALKYASEQGLVHRDVKPGNIFLTQTNEQSPRAVLLDFGLVRQLELNDGSATVTATHAVLGSPLYMSPEQCRGAAVDSSSDIYSLGCTMHEALSGEPPFLGDTAGEILLKQMNEPPRMLQAFQNSKPIRSALPQLIHKCLSKAPAERYSTFQELESAFNHALLSTASTATFTPPRTPITRASKRVALIAIVCSLALAVLAGLSIYKFSGQPRDSVASNGLTFEEKQKLDEIDKWKTRFESRNSKPKVRSDAGESLLKNFLDLASYYKDKENRLDDAEKVLNDALSCAHKMQSAPLIAACYKALSEVKSSRAQESRSAETRRKLLNDAESDAKTAIQQLEVRKDNSLKFECMMQLSLVSFQAGNYQTASTQVDQAVACGLRTTQSRLALGENSAREYAKKIEEALEHNQQNLTNNDKLAFCMTFLAILDIIDEGDSIEAHEPTLQYAHEWFKKSGIAEAGTINGVTAAQLQARLDEYDRMAAHPRRKNKVKSILQRR
ncbi:MAG: serine/threonine protein kinase [Candidatus Obscuribacterales bacterium]|nr:serine/threonine protein kinase [Candidatus Obscuribacterales bacterium]